MRINLSNVSSLEETSMSIRFQLSNVKNSFVNFLFFEYFNMNERRRRTYLTIFAHCMMSFDGEDRAKNLWLNFGFCADVIDAQYGLMMYTLERHKRSSLCLSFFSVC